MDKDQISFLPYVDFELPDTEAVLDRPWFGIVHTPEGPIPHWWTQDKENPYARNLTFFQSSAWKKNSGLCRALIAFSADHAKHLRGLTDIKVTSITCPIPENVPKWSPQAYEQNTNRKIIQWGWWVKRMHAIHMLWQSPFKRVFVQNFIDVAQHVFDIESSELARRNLYFDFMDDTLEIINSVEQPKLYDSLQGNIAFAHYYAASAPDAVLDCIASHTPILVNALPSIVEYLGEDYPLYYHFYAEAVDKLRNAKLILKAHEHLKDLSTQKEFSVDYFKQQINDYCKIGK
jgi:hypothetical protein